MTPRLLGWLPPEEGTWVPRVCVLLTMDIRWCLLWVLAFALRRWHARHPKVRWQHPEPISYKWGREAAHFPRSKACRPKSFPELLLRVQPFILTKKSHLSCAAYCPRLTHARPLSISRGGNKGASGSKRQSGQTPPHENQRYGKTQVSQTPSKCSSMRLSMLGTLTMKKKNSLCTHERFIIETNSGMTSVSIFSDPVCIIYYAYSTVELLPLPKVMYLTLFYYHHIELVTLL